MEDLVTICSVSYNSAGFLRLNRQITEELNPGVSIRWVVAENSPQDSIARLADDEPGMTIIEGAGSGHFPTYHHTLALQRCIEHARSRFVLVIDPDLFVVRRDWVTHIVAHMRERDLAILGVPWHPQSNAKYRYFPAVHFSMFDTVQFPSSAIDFRPDFPDLDEDPRAKHMRSSAQEYFVRSRTARWLAKLPPLKHRRRFYTDTGSRLYKRWVDEPTLNYEILDPVWDPDERDGQGLSLMGSVLQYLLPDELCYRPKGYSTQHRRGFLDDILSKEARQNWEQFLWRDAPFCFHVRLNRDRSSRNADAEIEAVSSTIRKLT